MCSASTQPFMCTFGTQKQRYTKSGSNMVKVIHSHSLAVATLIGLNTECVDYARVNPFVFGETKRPEYAKTHQLQQELGRLCYKTSRAAMQ